MAEAEDKKSNLFDTLIGRANQLGDVYSKIRLADKGVAPTVVYQTNGANDPLVKEGQPAAVKGNDPLADAINNVTTRASQAYIAKQASDSMPYVVGLVALGITIYLLTRKG